MNESSSDNSNRKWIQLSAQLTAQLMEQVSVEPKRGIERERERDIYVYIHMYMCIYIYIYAYVCICI